MAWRAPIIVSQNQEENENDGDSSLRAKKYMKISTITSGIFFLGLYFLGFFFFIGRSSIFNFPFIYFLLSLFILIGIISALIALSKSRSQNYSQRKEPYRLNHNILTSKKIQKFCHRCGNIVDKNIDNLSIYYCSYCGYEIKNIRI